MLSYWDTSYVLILLKEGYLQYHRMYWYLTEGYLQYCLTEGYLQYHRMYWYLWSYWGIFTVSSYVLIPLILRMRDIYSIIVYIDTCGLTEGYLTEDTCCLQYHRMYWYLWSYSIIVCIGYLQYIIVCIDTFDLTEGYLQYHRYVLIPVVLMRDNYSVSCGLNEGDLQYHRMYWYLWSYWRIFTVLSYVLRDWGIYSIIVYIDTCGLTEGYLQYHRMYWYSIITVSYYWYMWSYWGIFTVSSYILIPVVLLRDIYSIIVCIDTCGLYSIIVYI